MTINDYKEILAFLKSSISGSEYEGHVFSVGGCERDKRLHKSIKDVDIVVDIPNGGIRFATWLYKNGLTITEPVVYEHFGTAMFVLKKFPDFEIEAVQTRKECYRSVDSRNPETAFGTLQDDCTRRDFTINAFYYNISTDEELDINGRSTEDLSNGIIRTCGDPEIIFNEDPLRILRMVRFASRMSFKIDRDTFECAKKYVYRLNIISTERIHDEFMKMCTQYDFSLFADAMFYLWDIGAFKYVIPHLHEFSNRERFYFMKNIEEFWAECVYPSTKELFAAMLYDCTDAEEEMRELKCPNEFIKEVMFLIGTSRKFIKAFEHEDFEENEEFVFRKFMYICGSSRRLQTVLSLNKETRDFFLTCDYLEETTFRLMEDGNLSYYTYNLPVDGHDVMKELEIGPSKTVSEVLNRLLKFAFVNQDYTDRESLLSYLRYIKREYEKS